MQLQNRRENAGDRLVPGELRRLGNGRSRLDEAGEADGAPADGNSNSRELGWPGKMWPKRMWDGFGIMARAPGGFFQVFWGGFRDGSAPCWVGVWIGLRLAPLCPGLVGGK